MSQTSGGTGTGTQFTRLFSPLQVGSMRVPNRICETTNSLSAGRLDGLPDPPFIEHHVAKARGGTGWIGSETWMLNAPLPASAADEFFPGAAATRFATYLLPNFVERVAPFCDAVREAGSVSVFQLTHLNMTLAPSAVPPVEPYDWIPRELDEEQIEFLIGTYVAASEKIKEAGADGIEIHCAHETLPHMFLSPATNRRTDRWGGDERGRVRFVTEILERVRARIGDSVALGIRVNGVESREGGYTQLQMREMLSNIAETGLLDFADVDVGHCWGYPSYVMPSHYGHAEYRDVGRALKVDLPDVALLFSGRVNDPGIAEQLLKENVCDLVGMTRAGIADPEFGNKAREGRMMEIRRCIGCNRCIHEAVQPQGPFRKPTCSVNPEVGNEVEWKQRFVPAAEPRRVVVVGGGAAGLEAARVAAERGHRVTLFEREKALGGQVRIASRAPGRDSFDDFVYYEENAMERLGVDLRLGVEVDISEIEALAPEAIVCATGSVPRLPETPGIDAPHVVQGWDVLAGTAKFGERVAVISQEDYFETPSVAEYLADRGAHVEIFHKWLGIGSQIDRYSIGVVMRRLEEHGVVVHPGLRLAGVENAKLQFTSAFSGATRGFEGFDTVVLVYGSVPDDRLYRELKAKGTGAQLFLAGSAWVPRRLAEATQHGARVGLEI